MKTTLLSALLAIIFLATTCPAQQLSRKDREAEVKIDRVVNQQMLANKIPGIIFLANSWETRDFKLARGLAAAFYPAFSLPDVKTIADPDPKTTALIRRALMQVAMRKLDENLFTPDCRAAMLGDDGKQIAQSLNAFSLPVAIIHSSELIETGIQSHQRLYRYLLTDIGGSVSLTVQLSTDNKIASIQLRSVRRTYLEAVSTVTR